MADFDNSELLRDIRDRGSLPPQDLRFTDAKLLSAASVELRDVIATLLVESQTDRAVYLANIPLVAGQAEYRLPSRAFAGRWQSVAYVEPGGALFRLQHLHPEDYFRQNRNSRGAPTGFFVRDNRLVLVPTPDVAGSLQVPYYMRPNSLVLPSAAATVGSVNGNDVALLNTPPLGFSGAIAYDLVRGTPGFETLGPGVSGTLLGSVLTLSAPPPSELAPGDYVCLAGQSPAAQCPVELRGLLATRAARRALKSVNEAQQASMLDADVTELEAVARSLLAPRADAEPKEWGNPSRGLLAGLI